jgi:hypothetical protein
MRSSQSMLQSVLLLYAFISGTHAFSASPQPSFLEGITSFFNPGGNDAVELRTKRENLKMKLLDVCKGDKVDRTHVESIIEELKGVQSFEETARSPLLQKEWLL